MVFENEFTSHLQVQVHLKIQDQYLNHRGRENILLPLKTSICLEAFSINTTLKKNTLIQYKMILIYYYY